MILFKSYHVQPILDGRKTQTRRKGKKRWNIGAVHQCKTSYYGEPFARVQITGVCRELLKDISEDDARREGCTSVSDYIDVWLKINGEWHPSDRVWVVDFELVREGEAPE